QLQYAGEVPGDDLVMVEYFPSEDGWGIVFHALYGRRVNDALSRAYASALSKMTGLPVRVSVSDNGFMLTLPTSSEPPRSMLEELLSSITPESLREVLEDSISRTELMKRRFKHVATRMFVVLRRYKGHEVNPERIQLSTQKLLEIFREVMPDSPPVRETFREILEDYMDIVSAQKVLEWMRQGKVRTRLVGPLPYPSPMAHGIVVRGYSDVVLMEDKRRLLLMLREKILEFIETKARSEAN
ncbi:MAG: ATP-dependent helicase, partial [Aeropyrum sp.]|nr:ATP-dependent helicase [Aeropyrum sp.]